MTHKNSITVFYLDDEAELAELFRDLFSTDQITIRSFSKVQDFYLGLKNERPDVIFLDFRLPGITGDIIALELNNKIPKYLVTGELSVKTEYAFNKVLSKPFIISEIEEVFQNQLLLMAQGKAS